MAVIVVGVTRSAVLSLFVFFARSMPMCVTIRAHVLIIEVYVSVLWENIQLIMELAFDFVWVTLYRSNRQWV